MSLVAIDNGHGIDTPGKRSPISLGEPILREYIFARDVAKILAEELRRCNITYLFVAPEETDTKLAYRVARAKKDGCKLYISIHANAGGGTGIETFYEENSADGNRLARLVQSELVKATKLNDRGIKAKVEGSNGPTSLYVTKETQRLGIVGILTELGFMDTKKDLALLRTVAYKKTCAQAICKAVCLYLGVSYIK